MSREPMVTVEQRPELEQLRVYHAFPLERIAAVMDELGRLLADLPNPGLGDRSFHIEIEAAADPRTGETERVMARLALVTQVIEAEGLLVYKGKDAELVFSAMLPRYDW